MTKLLLRVWRVHQLAWKFYLPKTNRLWSLLESGQWSARRKTAESFTFWKIGGEEAKQTLLVSRKTGDGSHSKMCLEKSRANRGFTNGQDRFQIIKQFQLFICQKNVIKTHKAKNHQTVYSTPCWSEFKLFISFVSWKKLKEYRTVSRDYGPS